VFLIGPWYDSHRTDWSRWFAISSPPPICYLILGEIAKKQITKLGCEKYFCRVTYWAQVEMLLPQVSTRQVLGRGWVSLEIIQVRLVLWYQGQYKCMYQGSSPCWHYIYWTSSKQGDNSRPKIHFLTISRAFWETKRIIHSKLPPIKIATELKKNSINSPSLK